MRRFFVTGNDEAVWVGRLGRVRHVPRPDRRRVRASAGSTPGHEDLSSPMPGKVLEVLVTEGEQVKAGQRLLVIEAMKMENPLRAPHDSVVTRIHVDVGESVTPGDTIVELEATP